MNDIFQVADLQHGLFTAKQAKPQDIRNKPSTIMPEQATGFANTEGIYRLSRYPQSEWDEDVQGVFSHETALSLYELSDVMPAKLYILCRMDLTGRPQFLRY